MQPSGPNSSQHTPAPNSKTAIAQAQFYAQKQQYSLAENTINQALDQHPNDAQLIAAQKAYRQLSDKELDQLALDALVKRANWLKSEIKVKETQAINSPSTLKSWQIRQLKNENAPLNQELLDCAEKNLTQPATEYWTSQCLAAIDKPLLSAQQGQQFEAITAALHKKQQKRQATMTPPAPSPTNEKTITAPNKAETNPNATMQGLENALNDKNYQRAQTLNKRLQKTGANSEQAQALLKRSETEIHLYTKQLASQADQFYLQEKVAEADALWLELLAFYPDNDEYRQNHERAEKILKNIQSIKQDSLEPVNNFE